MDECLMPCCSATTANCGPASPVLPRTRSTPIAEVAVMTSMACTWLRASRPIRSPGPKPISVRIVEIFSELASSSA
ncbi:hypothetical protein B277_15364 [Janibacter hoylei PVAS-1]|uniref:Uncharacterized protein n=1 Tax=Janibacter hoylei PVAS-1 TaxID=1210046 RepID=K1DU06_9MICO|nr:hypothetical protein B277_15364 [Janibacter hoylei PVAS-1]